MNRHLTEQELIEFQFKLDSVVRREKISGHLEDCTSCREHLEKLQRKFSSLELLREEIKASDDLISSVVEQAAQPVRPKVVWFRQPAWLGAAAAVILVGSILLISNLRVDSNKRREITKGPTGKSSYVEGEVLKEKEFGSGLGMTAEKLDGSDRAPLLSELDATRPASKTYAPSAWDYKSSSEKDFYDSIDGMVVGGDRREQIFEKPPFAPASAIELVVLPRRDKVQLTIYNSADLTLVRERRNLTLKRGWNWLQFMWANTLIDPTSLSLESLDQVDKIDIQQLVFPARLRELGRWLIRSEVSGQVPFEITYFTSGLNWRAFYMGTLAEDEKTMQLQGYVRVGNNSGEDYDDAQTRLIVGKVHILDQIADLAKRQYPYGRPGEVILTKGLSTRRGWREAKTEMEKVATLTDVEVPKEPKEIKKEGLSEYFLYSIEGTETIADKWGKRLLSFEAEDIKVKSLYKYDEDRWGPQTIRFVAFTNDEEHNLGQTPIPNGNVKIYGQADSEGYLSYVGGADIKYVPVNEEVELNLGPARLVKVEPKLMDFKTENYVYDRKGNITGWDEVRTWEIKITNTRELPIEIEITRGFSTAYWVLNTDGSYEKHDATHARFKLNLEPRSKWMFGYTVTTYHGMREETLAKTKK